MARSENAPLRSSRLIILAAVCVSVGALYFARDVLIPLALAVLLSFLLTPLVVRLERAGLHRVPAVLIVFVGLLALVGVLGWVVYLQVADLADQLPRYQDDIVAKVRYVIGRQPGDVPGAFEKAATVAESVTRELSAPTTTATQPSATAPAGPAGPAGETGPSGMGAPIVGPGWSIANPLPVTPVPEKTGPFGLLGEYIERVIGPLGTGGLVLVFVLFMLITREDMRDRLIRLIGYGQIHLTTQALDDAATRISRYLLAQAIVNGTYGVAIAIGLWAIGYFVGGEIFPNFVLWALLCAILRFIPYIGPWIAAAFPIALSFAVFPGYRVFVAVCLMFVVIELLSNNFMEPWLYGSSTGMSTVAVLVSAVFWTWMWGPIGLVMATPLTVCLVVIGKYVPQLQFFDIMLGDEPVLEPSERVYQRLLAMDQEEATDILEEYRAQMPLEQLFGTVMLPALALAEVDRHAGRLDERRSMFIRNAMRQMIEEIADEERLVEVRRQAEHTEMRARGEVPEGSAAATTTPVASVATSSSPAGTTGQAPVRARVPKDCVINVVLLPAHDPADEIVALMLAQLLELRGYCALPVSHNALASEMLGEVERTSADVVVVSALPPAAVAHARYLCKRLHARFPEVNTVVGLWTVKGDLKKARERIACSTTVKLATEFAVALEQINELVQPKLLQSDASRDAAATTTAAAAAGGVPAK
jgi:predicted PurR-regulated permease PerM